jgi:zinc protease
MRFSLASVPALVLASLLALAACQPTAPDSAVPTKTADPDKPKAVTPAVTPVAAASKDYAVLQSKPDRLMVELPNRLIVIAQEIRTAPVVSAQVWIKTGSIYEQEHVGAGLSHFLEHLLSGGTTTTRSEEDANKILGKIGARTNAATSLQQVYYYINTTRPYAADAVGLLSDWMQNSIITEPEYKREQEVIQREFEMGQGEPDRIFWKMMMMARYSAHPARHPTIGYLDEFLKISRAEIQDFYKRMYVPNNMVFVVAGDIDKQAVIDQVARLWKDAKPGELPKLSFPTEPAIEKPIESTGVADVRRPRVRISWPGTRLGGDGDFALDLLGSILGHGESSRLVRTVRDEQRLVNSISAYNFSVTWGEGYFGIDADVAVAPPAAGTDPGAAVDAAIAKARESILAEVERIKKDGVTPAELARAKRQTIAQVVFSAQTAEDMADRLARDVISTGDPDYLQRYAEAVQKVTADEIKAAASKFLVPQRTITLKLMPSAGNPPPQLTRPKDDIDPKTLKPQPFDLDNRELIKLIRARGNEAQAAASAAAAEPVKAYTLSNGLKLLVGRSTTVPAVAIELYHEGGLLADAPGKEGVANAAWAMLIKGTRTRTAQQIATQIEDLGAALGGSVGNNVQFTKASCLKDDWKTVLELLADITLNPTFPEDEWTNFQRRLVAAIDRQADTWDGELGLRFRENFFKGHAWQTRPIGRSEVVAALKAADLAAYHRQSLGADQAVLCVFGDVNPDEVAKKAEELFKAMPAKAPVAFKPVAATYPAGGTLEFPTRKQTTAVCYGFGPGVARTDPDFAAIQVMLRVINNFPVGWLDQALRGSQPALVYAVGAYQQTGVIPGYIAFLFNCKAADTDEAIKRTNAVIQRIRAESIDEATLARAKAAVLTGEFFGKQSNSDRATEAALNELYGLPADESEKFLAAVQATDAKKVQAMAVKYLKAPMVVVIKEQAAPAK